jgi:uncharacterized membrane protein
MTRVSWPQAVAFGVAALVVLLVAVSILPAATGWPGGMMSAGGLMGPGMMGGWGILGWLWMLLIPLLFLVLLILSVLWLARELSSPASGRGPAADAVPCPHCSRLVQVGWRACPYCGAALTVDGPPPGPSS